MNTPPFPDYRSYLLRLWRETADLPWRATLEDPRTGEQYGFASLARLFAYLEAQTDLQSDSEERSAS